MADYIYLLESRLSQAQQRAIHSIREIARAKGLTVFLVGGAVRDLTSGSPVRDLDVVLQGNALKLKKDLEKAGASISGEIETLQALLVEFPGSVRMEVGSALMLHYPKPGKPVAKPANILEDLRRRDFTANAMALSLNEGSYGLLMDPLNGVADIENREFRLVSNYGFIEDPVRMIRAARLGARLGWQMEEKTRARYETGKSEGYISAMSGFQRGYETEEIAHEEDPLRVIRALEREGWMKQLAPAWTSAKANAGELEKLREAQMQLQMRGIVADTSAAQFPLLTAKMQAKDVKGLKKSFPRHDFVKEIEALESAGKRFAAEFGSKQAATPSAAWKMLMAARPEAVLWAAYSTKNAGLQAKFKSFYTEWPQAKQKIPYVQMQEMRIVPDLPIFEELVDKLFFELMDGRLTTPEEMKAFLEPYSPPAPPPPVHLRRARATKKDAKPAKSRKKVSTEIPAEDAESTNGAAAVVQPVIAAAGSKAAKALALPALPAKGAAVAKQAAPVAGKAEKGKPAAAKVEVPAKAPTVKAVVVKESKAAGTKHAAKVPAKKLPAKKSAAKPAKSPAKKAAAKKTPAKTAAKKNSKPASKPAAKKVVAKNAKKPAPKGAAKKKR